MSFPTSLAPLPSMLVGIAQVRLRFELALSDYDLQSFIENFVRSLVDVARLPLGTRRDGALVVTGINLIPFQHFPLCPGFNLTPIPR
jgi:hypothetical protein